MLMRHAKSSHDDVSLSDHDRPLNRRGARAAPAMGRWLAGAALVPDRIVSSTALRALQTARAVAEACGYARGVEATRRLYLASPEEICSVIADLAGDSSPILIVAHNPGVELLVSHWTGRDERMPTAAIARFEVTSPWRGLTIAGPVKGLGVWCPKQLEDTAS